MTISGNKTIYVNGTTFSFNALLYYPTKYLPLIIPFFRTSSLIQKDGESDEAYLNRLFSACYYKKGLAADTINSRVSVTQRRHRMSRREAESLAIENSNILNALGIDVVKYNSKISKVLFKSSGNQYRMNNAEMEKLVESIKSKPNFKRKKLKVKIGVELEFIGQRGHIDEFNSEIVNIVGNERYECLLSYNHNAGDKWVLGIDGSLRYEYGERGYELTSPKLDPSSKNDMEELRKVTELVKRIFSGYTNNSCGTHIHMSFNTDVVGKENKIQLRKFFACSYHKNEDKLFDKVVPIRRRNDRSRWCRTSDPYFIGDRYRKLNFRNDSNDKSELHLEFRQLDGTLDFNKIYSWIKLQKMFSEITLQNFKCKDDWFLNKSVEYSIEEALTDKVFESCDIESLLKEGKLIA